MNTITDLRRTLDQHAGDVADSTTVARTTAVHHRVAVVRRRRRTGAVATLALVGLGVVAAVVPHHSRDVQPAAPRLLGVQAPTTITSLGYTYRSDGHGTTFDGSGALRIARSDSPRLFSWTMSPRSSVEVQLPDRTQVFSQVSRFQDYVVVPAGESGRLKVASPGGRVAIASYDLTDLAPRGYTKAGITYRQEVAGSPLLGASVGDLGATSVTTTFRAPDGLVDIGVMCTRLPKGDVINVSFGNGGPISSSSCDSDGSFDPGASSFTGFHPRHPGRAVTVHAWVSPGFHDSTVLPAGSVPGLRLGVGLYGAVSEQRVGGARLPRTIEYGGHTWALASDSSMSAGRTMRLPSARVDRVASMIWRTHGHTMVTFGATGRTPTGSSSPGGVGSLPEVWVPAGAGLRAAVTRGSGTFGVALYERVG